MYTFRASNCTFLISVSLLVCTSRSKFCHNRPHFKALPYRVLTANRKSCKLIYYFGKVARGGGGGALIEQSRINPNGPPGLFHFAGWSVYQTRASDVPGCSILQNGGVIKRLKAAICLPEVNLYLVIKCGPMLKLSRLVIKCGPIYIYWAIQLAKRRNIFSKKND